MTRNKKERKRQDKLEHSVSRVISKASTFKKKARPKKATRRRTAREKHKVRGKSQRVAVTAEERQGLGPSSGGQSGDLQGLPSIAGADAESVEELVEEGNAFEAEIIKGVEDAEDSDEAEVVTHQVSEDDVPKEYVDENQS